MYNSSLAHVCRVGHATFRTPQLDRMLAYYVDIIGLSLVDRLKGRAFLKTRTGQLAIELEQAEHPDCVGLAFEIAPDQELDPLAERMRRHGIDCEIRRDCAPGVKQAVAFKDPNGTTIQLFNSWEPVGAKRPTAGISPVKLGHVAFTTLDVKSVSDFYMASMGFRVSDWIEDKVTFLRCNSDHHSANFFQAGVAGVQHIAFELTDFAHIRHACDTLVQNDMPVVYGPVRTGPGHNVMAVHINPDGHAVECYAELDQMKNEALGYFDPRPWHREFPQRPKVWAGVASSNWGPPLDKPKGRNP